MAIGSQTHANLIWPEPDLEDSSIAEVSRLGLPIHITELDVDGSQAGQRNQSATSPKMPRPCRRKKARLIPFRKTHPSNIPVFLTHSPANTAI